MKILKSGSFKDPEKWRATVTCMKKDKFDTSGCRAKMEIDMRDLFLMYWEGTHFQHHYTAVRCPQCGKYNRVRNVPDYVLEKVWTCEAKRAAVFDGFSESIY